MMLYIYTKEGRLLGPYPEDIANRKLADYPRSILATEMMRKSILRNREINKREARTPGL